jgi:hypothetical protein
VTFRTTVQQALAIASATIQIATWNDWGESTMIEPSVEFGYRDIEVLQEMRRKHMEPSYSATGSDLRMPSRLFVSRRNTAGAERTKQLDRIAELIAAGRTGQAQSRLKQLEDWP